MEAPSHLDISSLATSIGHADSDWGQPKTPYTEQEEFKSSCIKYSSAKDLTDLSDSLEDRRDSPDKSETHLTQETISSLELQKSNEALQVLDMGLIWAWHIRIHARKPILSHSQLIKDWTSYIFILARHSKTSPYKKQMK
jgi:hypothetical protein